MPQVRLRKPKAILFDIAGTVTHTTFMDKVLAAHIRRNAATFVHNNWANGQIQADVELMRTAAAKNKSWPQIPPANDQAAVCDSVAKLANHLLDSSDNADCLGFAQLRFHMWFDAYAKGQLTTAIYSDVAIQMKRWRCDYDIKLFVVSHGWSEANKVFMSRTNQGDMTLLIDGYFDTKGGAWEEGASFKKLLEGQLHLSGGQGAVVLFTKTGAVARAAATAGIMPIIVTTHQKCFDALNEEEKKMAIIRTMNEVEFE
ncbi:Enolase-phosphatase E1 [Tyrophagus putrescentiae]|nr:Enolase-phosphatase E1 [Tyrophagus putrescentiae]